MPIFINIVLQINLVIVRDIPKTNLDFYRMRFFFF